MAHNTTRTMKSFTWLINVVPTYPYVVQLTFKLNNLTYQFTGNVPIKAIHHVSKSKFGGLDLVRDFNRFNGQKRAVLETYANKSQDSITVRT